jgi:hypothetical protein
MTVYIVIVDGEVDSVWERQGDARRYARNRGARVVSRAVWK